MMGTKPIPIPVTVRTSLPVTDNYLRKIMENMNYRSWLRVAVLALVGVSLILNPFYLSPDGGGDYKKTYEATEIDPESDTFLQILGSDRILACPGNRICPFERNILEEETYETNAAVNTNREKILEVTNYHDFLGYVMVYMNNTWYLPKERVEGDTTILSLEEVSSKEAIEHAAIPAEKRPEEVLEAIETGSVTVYDTPIQSLEETAIYEHDDKYYGIWLSSQEPHWTGSGILPAVRLVLIFFGSGLVFYTGWTVRSIID
ncbi:hypothetical protein [Natrinema halophilum]|uniref:Uncharacterized protein n=1 Tax=Natrinema halophilum TaxID=1699371 RepID=A0A7D5GGN8_9EURY|nr:hypothetical protein [Natrinema halophilum]QLG48414.1 hypothetical protein HYG82_05915 [Natrinema halophilum]